MSKLRSFLKRRIREVESELAVLNAEYRELLAAREALPFALDREEHEQSFFDMDRPDPSELTIKEKILFVLEKYPEGAEASELLDLVNKEFDDDIERTSFSPQLSRLRQEGKVVRHGSRYIIPRGGVRVNL